MKNKKIVVTGGAGFIGSNIAEELANENEIIILDDFTTGRRENILKLLKKENVRLIKGSVTDIALLKEVFDNVDYVFHQAADPSVQGSIENPIGTNEANIVGTLNILTSSKETDIKKIVFASSSSVYGNTIIIPQVETMKPDPTSPYAVTKLTGEYYCKVFYELYGLSTTSLRYFNVYGPKQDPNSQYAAVIPKFINRVMQDKQPIIYGDGEQTRDFIFVKDVVKANLLAAERKKANGEIINIAFGKRVSINDLAKQIFGIFGKKLKALHTKPLPGDVKHSLADISKAKEMLGFKPKYSLEDGLRYTIDYFTSKAK